MFLPGNLLSGTRQFINRSLLRQMSRATNETGCVPAHCNNEMGCVPAHCNEMVCIPAHLNEMG